MQKLPFELQLSIIEHLDALDIFHLELTCKDFRNLVEDSAKVVWQHCLRRHCVLNNLFAPSYNRLKLGAEMKEACTKGYRLYKTYEHAKMYEDADSVSEGRGLSCNTILLSLQIPPDTTDLSLDDMYLIPGGRFLVTLHGRKWLSVWDLSPPDGIRPSFFNPALTLQEAIEGLEAVELMDTSDCGSIMAVVKVRTTIDHGTPLINSASTMSSHKILRLDCTTEDEFSVQDLGSLSIVRPEDPIRDPGDCHFLSMYQSSVIFHFRGMTKTTLLWDFKANKVCGWVPNIECDIYEGLLLKEFVLYVAGDGLHAVAIPPLMDLETRIVSLDSFTNNPDSIVRPLLFLPHPRRHPGTTVQSALALKFCDPRAISSGNRDGIMYEIRELEPLDDPFSPEARTTIYRYRLNFDPTDPRRSTSDLVEIASLRVPPDIEIDPEIQLYPHPYQVSTNGRLAAVWSEVLDSGDTGVIDTGRLFLSLSSSFNPLPTSPSSSTARLEDADLFSSIGRTELKPVELMHAYNAQGEIVESIGDLCPSSGTVAVLWRYGGSRSVLTLYEISGLQ